MSLVRAKSDFMKMMAKGQRPFGIFVSSIDPAVTEIMGAAGFDYVVIDGEHGRNDRSQVENHVRAAAASRITPFVRILENSQTLIQATLDVGAQGIVVPHIDTAEDALRAVQSSYYAPKGRRGMCPACYAGNYTMDKWIERTRTSDENVMVIPILESLKSIENIDEILRVDGIDVVFFGPGDLSADMGIDLNTNLAPITDAWRTVLTAVRKAGKHVLAPIGFDFDEADMYIAPMEYVVLSDVASRMVADYRGAQEAEQNSHLAASGA
jgi:4-hydroxy-2-oxoheptanedioate aldolase